MSRAPDLHPVHLADLRKSGLTDETIGRLGFSDVCPRDIKLPVTSMLRIPYFDLDGAQLEFERFKLFPSVTTKDGTRKYHQPPGSDCHAYLPPLIDWRGVARDATKPLVITEGEKKAAKATQDGWPTQGIGGVWNWKK